MKAITYSEYGPPEVLSYRDVEKPVPDDDEVLIKVHAASVNAADLDLLRGVFMIRLGGLLRPQYRILGSDVAGEVEAVGANVTEFLPGDEVFGDLTTWRFGAFAEYVCVPEKALALKPANLAFEAAAAAPSAAGVALLNLRAKRRIQPGDNVLINGAGGGMGTFAVQMAKASGAVVTGVDTEEKLDIVQSLGADHVIDYRQEDFTKNSRRYDMILDVAAHRSIFNYKRALRRNGAFVFVGGSMASTLQAVFLGPWISMMGSRKMGIVMAYPGKGELLSLKELLEAGTVRPVIDRTYPLEEVGKALRYLENGSVRGKVVIRVG